MDPVVPEGGNTKTPSSEKDKRCAPARKWCFTWNNYPSDWQNILVPGIQGSSLFGCQPEVGENGTPHIQGWVEFKTKLRPLSLKLPKEIHWEKMKGTISDSIEYCSKSETKAGDYISNKKAPRPLPTVTLYGWQSVADKLLEAEPDNREIFWIWSRQGKRGKSTFVRHLAQNRQAVICAGKAGDMKHQIVKFHEKHEEFPDIVAFDVPRSMENYLSYTGIEEIKNGVFASSKYESDMVIMPYAHVVILSNFPPDMNNKDMSSDRFKVWNITEDIQLDIMDCV